MRFDVKNTTFPGILDLLAPHSCRGCGRIGAPLCVCCKNNLLKNSGLKTCPNCGCKLKTKNNSKEIISCTHCNFPPIFAVGERSDLLDLLIHDYKYNSVRALAKNLAELLHFSMPDYTNCNVVIVPIPTASHHIRERGIDHTFLLAKNLMKLRKCKVQKLLLRNKNTVQVGADKKTRERQAAEAFKINPKATISPDTLYIILDDVWTTGSSIKSAVKILKSAGAKNLVIALLAVSQLK